MVRSRPGTSRLCCQPASPAALPLGQPRPESAKPLALPANHRVRLHVQQRTSPCVPTAGQTHPEQPIEGGQNRVVGAFAGRPRSAAGGRHSPSRSPHGRSTEVERIGRWTKRGWPCSPIVRLYPVSRQSVPDRPINGERQLEDAVVLAHCLSETRPVEAALRKYEHLRIPRTTAIVQSSWQTGKALQLDSPTLEKFRNWFMGTCLGTRLGGRAFRSLLTYQLPELRSRKHNPSS